MSYITLEQIRPYLIGTTPSAERVIDQPRRLSGLDWICFHAAAVDDRTVIVKSGRTNPLTRAQFTVTDSPLHISELPVVTGSLLVASNSSLTTIYHENIDYLFDSFTHQLTVKPGGALQSGSSIVIWFEPYSLYVEGSDYALNADRGEMRRLASGDIGDGEMLLIDFTPRFTPFSDDLLTAAISEANGLIEREIDPEKQFGADPTLSSAARSIALEIICRSAALRELLSGNSLDKLASAWQSLADTHANRAARILDGFRPPKLSPKSPTIR